MNRLDPPTFELVFDSKSPEATCQIARRLGETLRGGEVIALVGDLGSGKTTFTRGLCLGLGLDDARQVSSPTYVLEHLYAGRFCIHHYDAYRLVGPEEFVALGFRDHLSSESILVIEWADKVLESLPPERLEIELSMQNEVPNVSEAPDSRRRIRFSGPREVWGHRLGDIFPTKDSSFRLLG